MSESFKSGFVALVGRPSVGKSSLLNAAIGTKRAIVSPVAQTTRKRLRAIVNRPKSQIIIVDTPGLHKPKDALGKELNKVALHELADVDVVACMIDAAQEVGRGDAWLCEQVAQAKAFKILVINKIDLVKPEQVQAQIEAASKLCDFDATIALSAKENFNIECFLDLVESELPEGPRWFGEDTDCDATDEELVAEFIREKLLYKLRQEIPHSVAVICDEIEWKKDKAAIYATIMVEREGQKAIVIGKGGSLLKQVGISARKDIERLYGIKVYLDLQVRVRPMWRRDQNEIRRLGLEHDGD